MIAQARLKRNEWVLSQLLSRYKTTEELYQGTKHQNLEQHRSGPISRGIFTSLFDYFNNKFTSLLDLGPGSGDSLDIARERGAEAEFADYDPYIFAYNHLKGYRGYFVNYIVGKGLTALPESRYDFILSKGSVNADQFNRHHPHIIPFNTWMNQVERLAMPGARIVICPTFDKGTKQALGSYHVCEDPDRFRVSEFSTTLLSRGYEATVIPGFNWPVERFPVTFHKKMEVT